jgi:DNA invertase Pin-like site-specific DNA recombinase
MTKRSTPPRQAKAPPRPVALVYARASNDPTDQRISVDRQVKLCSARAQQLWPDAEVRVHRDDGRSAADPNVQRPGYASFLADVRSARTDELAGIVVNEQSRLTRQGNSAWDELVVTLTKAGITQIETLRSGPISVEPGNRLVGRILAVIDAEEVERTKARVQAAHRQLFSEGRPSGSAPFGYRRVTGDDGRAAFEIDKVHARAVKLAFKRAMAGVSLYAIADELNDLGVPPRSAAWKFKDGRKRTDWKRTTVRALLSSASVAGLRGHTDEDGQVHTTPAMWDAIVDVDQWRAVQRVLGQPTVVTGSNGQTYPVRMQPRAAPRKYLLSGGRLRGSGDAYGVLICGRCGYPLSTQTQTRANGPRVAAYQCHPTHTDPRACGGLSISPTDAVDQLVVEAIQRRLAKSRGLRRRLDAAADAGVAGLRKERDAARARMIEAGEMFGAGSIDRATFEAMHAPAQAAHDAAQSKLSARTTTTTLPSLDDVVKRWDSLSLQQQRAVVERLIRRIVVAPDAPGLHGLDRVGVPEWLA